MKRLLLLWLLMFGFVYPKAQDKGQKDIKDGPGYYYEIPPGQDTVFMHPDKIAMFKGGIDSLGRFINTRLRYPQNAWDNHLQGRVIVEMIIEKDGRVTNLKITRGVTVDVNAEAMRVLRMMPNWNPAILNGKPVRTKFYLPVKFEIKPNTVIDDAFKFKKT